MRNLGVAWLICGLGVMGATGCSSEGESPGQSSTEREGGVDLSVPTDAEAAALEEPEPATGETMVVKLANGQTVDAFIDSSELTVQEHTPRLLQKAPLPQVSAESTSRSTTWVRGACCRPPSGGPNRRPLTTTWTFP